ncbi:P-loop containing nucleoside triphosphate hydrolase protein [Phycomyces nitens]|nr:P-loop containing nucleoside triphosphate hydrolase protein [Phycomyces nitens]
MEQVQFLNVWCSIISATVTCGSALVLSVQRCCQHQEARLQPEYGAVHGGLLYKDQKRNILVPFADNVRIPRMTFGTLGLVVLAGQSLYGALSKFLQEPSEEDIGNFIATAVVFVSWLYALVLCLVSRNHRLPNNWGWILNVHLFIFYLVTFSLTVYCLIASVWDSPGLSFYQGAPLLICVLLSGDLVYVTGTAERGQPFFDERDREVTRSQVCSIASFLVFNWSHSVIRVAYLKNTLSEKDLPSQEASDRGRNLMAIFDAYCEKSLIYRIVAANSTPILFQGFSALFASVMFYLPAYFVNKVLLLIQEISDGKTDDTTMGRTFSSVFYLGLSIAALGIVTSQLWYWANCKLEVRIKGMLDIEIYKKTLSRMDSASTADKGASDDQTASDGKQDQGSGPTASTGEIINLMSSDSARIAKVSELWISFFTIPIELCVGIFFVYRLMGASCFLGLLVLVIALPINHYNAKMYNRTQEDLMNIRDKRISLMNEVFQGIRQIKFQAWETSWEKRIMEIRTTEIDYLKLIYLSNVLFNFVWRGTPLLVTLVSLWSFTSIQGNTLTAATAFTSIAVFNELKYALNALPELFIIIGQASVSVKRIEEYLNEEEIRYPALSSDQATIGFEQATVAWTFSDAQKDNLSSDSSEGSEQNSTIAQGFVLKDINIQFPFDGLSLISGATGSGKTLMLLGLLGEAAVIQGKVNSPRSPILGNAQIGSTAQSISPEHWILENAVAYAAQTPWLQNASIRDNILFGLPFSEKRYNDTIIACALSKDLSYLEDGDMTEIGEKGITLSGGQKARVSLARAVYSRAKNVFMDDVLSAVDAHTAKHLYENCLIGPLMNSRTRILVTHHVKLCLNESAYVVHMNNGRVDFFGSPEELRLSGDLYDIIESEEREKALAEDEEEYSTEENAGLEGSVPLPSTNNAPQAVNTAPRVLVAEEGRASGHVKMRHYIKYLKMVGGSWFWIGYALLVFGCRVFEISSIWWVKLWSQSYAKEGHPEPTSTLFNPNNTLWPDNNLPESSPDDKTAMYFNTYVTLTAVSVFFITIRYAFLYLGTMNASKKLYAEMLHCVFRAPLRFFDTTPVGRILNRFSKDFETLDSELPIDIANFTIHLVFIVSTLIVVSLALPLFAIPMLIIGGITYFIGSRYIPATRELRRMISVERSPLFTHFTETIVGVSTIRAFGVTRQFMNEMLMRVDNCQRPTFHKVACSRWLTVRFSIAGAVINLATAITILLRMKYIDASTAGFCLAMVLEYADQMYILVLRYTSIELSMNSVERIIEFIDMDQEAPAITDIRPPKEWPSQGEIQIENLEIRYAPELDPVIKNISFSINSNEKIGLVGRTGSGKSTLAQSFFRFVEASQGSIVIDGIDIKTIGTEDLRSNLTIIPQDPILFSGTLRSNLDLFQQYDDPTIFTALKRVHLLPFEEEIEQGSSDGLVANANVFWDLSTPVSEGGKNFSQGQRQLLCLARALLKRTKIVFMDEATASVDFQTDKAIQKAIATNFADCTIVCIAHRLHTVIEYDRILVLDQGNIVEFASPLDLIRNTNSMFYKMCCDSGEFESLVSLVETKYQLVDVS